MSWGGVKEEKALKVLMNSAVLRGCTSRLISPSWQRLQKRELVQIEWLYAAFITNQRQCNIKKGGKRERLINGESKKGRMSLRRWKYARTALSWIKLGAYAHRVPEDEGRCSSTHLESISLSHTLCIFVWISNSATIVKTDRWRSREWKALAHIQSSSKLP